MDSSTCDNILATFAKKLTSNDTVVRNRNLKKLKSVLRKIPDDVSELSLLQLWKGLHYAMWMADKPLVQEQLADDLASIVHLMSTKDLSIRYFDAFMKISRKEWHLIDNFRQDKFMRLIRFVIRQTLIWLKNNRWEKEYIEKFCKAVERSFLSKESSTGDLFHILDLLLPEISKVSEGEVSQELIKNLSEIFIEILSRLDSKYLSKSIKTNFLSRLKSDEFKIDSSMFHDKVMNVASRKNVKNRAMLYDLIK